MTGLIIVRHPGGLGSLRYIFDDVLLKVEFNFEPMPCMAPIAAMA